MPRSLKDITNKTFLALSILLFLTIYISSPVKAQLTESPWPKAYQNNQNTGWSNFQGPTSDSLRWSYVPGENIEGVEGISIGKDGTIYVSTHGLTALTSDGTKKWTYLTANKITTTPAIGTDGTIYIGGTSSTEDNLFYAITPQGTKKWSVETGNILNSSPAIGQDGTIYVGSGNRLLYAIDSTGTIKWTYETGASTAGNSSPAIDHNGTIYIGSGKTLHAVNADSTGKWSYSTKGEIYSSPTVDKDGTIYVGSRGGTEGGYVYALHPSGDLKWEFSTPNDVNTSPAIGPDSVIYVTSNALYAINKEGKQLWKYEAEDTHLHSPTIDSTGTIYFTTNKKLHSVTPEGNTNWKYELKADTRLFSEISPVIGPTSSIYLGDTGSELYAVGGFEPTGIHQPGNERPGKITLKPNAPNPFNPSTKISFSLPEATDLELTVYNALGQAVETLIDQRMNAGWHSVTFDAAGLPSGVYIYLLKAKGFSRSQTMLLMK